MTEVEALRRYVDGGDAEAFRELVHRYGRVVYAACRRHLSDPADVEDAVQETFLRLAKRAGDVHTSLLSWLHQCAVRVSIDHVRRAGTRRRNEAASASERAMAGREASAADAAAWREVCRELDAALEALEAGDRELILGYFYEGTSQTELAKRAGVSQATLSRRVQGAVERLRAALKARGVTSAPGMALSGLTSLLAADAASAAVPVGVAAAAVKVGVVGVGTAGMAGAGGGTLAALTAKVTLVIAVLTLGLAGIGLWAFSGEMGTPSPALPASSRAAWPPQSVLPIELDGWWRLPGGDDLRMMVLSVDAFRGEVTLGQTGSAPSPGHVTYRVSPATATATVITNTIDPDAVGVEVRMRLALVNNDQIELVTSAISEEQVGDVTLTGERIGPARVFRPTGSPPASRPQLSVGTRSIMFRRASLDLILSLTVNDYRSPRSEIRTPLPEGGYDVEIDVTDVGEAWTSANGASSLLYRALLRELGIAIRTETRMMDVYLLRIPEGGRVRLDPPAEGANHGMIDVVDEQRVWHGHSLQSYARYIEDELGLPVVDDTGRGHEHFRYEEPWPLPHDHDHAEHFLQASSLEVVPGRREISVTIIEQADPAAPPALSLPFGIGMQSWNIPDLATLLGRVPGSTLPAEVVRPLQGEWRHVDGDERIDIVDDLALIVGVRQPWAGALRHWPRALQAVVHPQPRVVDVMRITALEPRADGMLLTLASGEAQRHLLVRIDGESMEAESVRDGSDPAVVDAGYVQRITLERHGPSPFADEVRAVQ